MTITQGQANMAHNLLLVVCAGCFYLLPKFVPNLTAEQADSLKTFFGFVMLMVQSGGSQAIAAIQQQTPVPPPK